MKKLNHATAAQLCLSASLMMENSLLQAQTAGKMVVAVLIERIRLLCPDQEAYDIGRLSDRLLADCKQLKDPLASLKSVADTRRIEPMGGSWNGLASLPLRAACRSVLAEIQAARDADQKAIEAIATTLPSFDALDEALSQSNLPVEKLQAPRP